MPDDVAYRARVGGHGPLTDKDMQNYTPKVEYFMMKGRRKKGTAAGAYQILQDSWEEASKALGLPNFFRDDQDKIALHMIAGKKALGDIRRGDLDAAFKKLRGIWVSLPGGSQSHHSRQEAIKKFDAFMNEEKARP